MFSLKGKRANIFSFAGHTVFVKLLDSDILVESSSDDL